MKIIVTTDSTSDLPKNIAEKNNVEIMPLIVNLGEDSFEDGVNICSEQIFEYVDKTGILPKTAARSAALYQEFFENALKKHKADALIHISLSSEISSSHENALLASKEFDNVKVIDSRSLSTGCALIVLHAVDLIESGMSFDKVCEELEQVREKVQASFVIDNLKYLYKGGRCSALAMFGANVLRIKPKIKVSNGKMGIDKKYMGKYESVVINYVNELLKENKNIIKNRVFITYTVENLLLNEKIITILKENGFEQIITNVAGSTIASHCGRNTLGVLFINE